MIYFQLKFLEQLLSLTFIFNDSISYIKKNKLLLKKYKQNMPIYYPNFQ